MPLTRQAPVIPRDDLVSSAADDRPRAGGYVGSVEQVYAWLRRHPKLVDGALALGLLASGASVFTTDSFRSSGAGNQAGLIAISLVLAGLVVVRRKHPLATYVIAIAIAVVQVALGMHPGAFQPVSAGRSDHRAALHPGRLPLSARSPCAAFRCA